MSKYQIMPLLTDEEYQSLKKDIAERGVIVPIELDEDGSILDGHHRKQAWEELTAEGVSLPDYPRVVRAGLTEEQKRNHIRALNIMRRHLDKEKRETLWAEMRKDGASYQEIADATGVHETTVIRAVPAFAGTYTNSDNIQPKKVKGKDGKLYPPTKKRKKKEQPKPPAAPAVSIYAGSDKQEDKAKKQAQHKIQNGTNGASQSVQTTIFSSESVEYYTPSTIIEFARLLMGDIDLDPASCEDAQETIKAKRYYTEFDDGLAQEWAGRVWLNPPYGKTGASSNQEIWANKLETEYLQGNVTEAVLLVKSALGYNWFEGLWDKWPVCFVRDRLSFTKNDGSNDGQSKIGTALFYLGPNLNGFIEIFGELGRITIPDGQYINACAEKIK